MTHTPVEAIEIAPHLHKNTLDNGLTVLVKETPGTKVATVQIWVKAGSIYEAKNEAGITHLIEHMIFKGTPTRAPGEVAGGIEAMGGQINAYTSYEYTVYHATLSSRNWGDALEVLTDAVLHSNFDAGELEREKKVVLEEISMRKDRANIALFQELMAQAYTVHPYRLPISGTAESVSAISREDILRYMKKHYHPNNFTVVVVGDVRVQQVVDTVNDLMGGLPKSENKPPTIPKEPAQAATRLFALTEDVNQTQLALAFPGPSFKGQDAAIVDVMTTILASGETSRLYTRLRNEKGLVYRIDGSAFTPRDPGLLEFTATLDAEKASTVLEEMLTEIFRMKHSKVSDEELDRAKRNLESDFIFNLERAEGQARVLGSFEFLTGDPREDKYLARVRAVSKEDIQRVAAFYLKGEHLTVGSIAPLGTTLTLNQAQQLAQIIAKAEATAKLGQPASQVDDAYLTGVHRFQLKNGIRLLVRENHDVPTVSIRAVLPGGLRSETQITNGAFAFISELLPKGTEKLSAEKLAKKVANMAGSLGGFNGKNTFGVKGDFLSRFTNEGLALVRDVIITPAFAPTEAEKIRPELLSQLKNQEDSLPSLGFKEFNKRLFMGHPYGLNTLGNETVINNVSVADLKRLYEEHARPEALVLAVAGDVDAETVRATVEKLFGAWRTAPVKKSQVEESALPPDVPVGPEIISIPRDKQQVHIIIGFVGTTLNSEDRYGLEVLDTALSGQSGRLFTELRDKESLAYSLSSFSLLGLDTGSFGIYIGTSPDKKDQAIKAVWQQLYRVMEEPLSEEELTKAKNVLISNYELGLQTRGNQAMEMALNETYGLGQDFGNRYVHALEQVDALTVQAMARKYIRPGNYVQVTVGASAAPLLPEQAPEKTPQSEAEPEAEPAAPIPSENIGE
ncbi:MAG: insulinase family protein [Desulfobulbaceae bacterium]|nr:insulinase family protein [Desulfobulbaceae bacterium]HIJ89339.1 insulinase family protein [Deltaproteobacteria bacterium]